MMNPVPNINTNAAERGESLTPDGLALVLSGEEGTKTVIEMTTVISTEPFPTPSGAHLTAVNAMGTEHQSPRLSSDRLRLYLAADSGVAGRLQLVVATRSSHGHEVAPRRATPDRADRSLRRAAARAARA
jgi:hypothetical protein